MRQRWKPEPASRRGSTAARCSPSSTCAAARRTAARPSIATACTSAGSTRTRWRSMALPATSNGTRRARHTTQVPVLADLPWQGRNRKLVLFANRNAFYYVLDRETGQYLLGKQYVRQTWAKGLDDNGRPMVAPGTDPTPSGNMVYPNSPGAT